MITQMNTMLSSEVWQDIQGYSGIYQVSTLGRIRSLKKGKIKLLKPYINNMGYAVLSLYANHKQKTYHVHKLVAETFLVKVDGKNYIDHINGIKTDNRIDNLRWCTPKENANFELSIITSVAESTKIAAPLFAVLFSKIVLFINILPYRT